MEGLEPLHPGASSWRWLRSGLMVCGHRGTEARWIFQLFLTGRELLTGAVINREGEDSSQARCHSQKTAPGFNSKPEETDVL